MLLAVCIGATSGLWAHGLATRDTARRKEARAYQSDLNRAVHGQLDQIRTTLGGVARLFTADGIPSNADFAAYTATVSLSQREPGLVGLGFVNVGPDGKLLVGEVSPPALTQLISGVDLRRLPGAVGLVDATQPPGSVAVTDHFRLKGASSPDILGDRTMFGVVSRLYGTSPTPARVGGLTTEATGWLGAVVDGQQFLQSVLARTPATQRIELFDGNGTSAHAAVATLPAGRVATERPASRRVLHVRIDHHEWTLRYQAVFDAESPQAASARRLLLWSGLALSFLVFLIAQLVRRSERRAQRMVNDTTESLRASQAWFEAIVQNATDIVFVVDEAGTVRYVSPSYERILGFAPSHGMGRPITDLVHPDDRERAALAFLEFVEGNNLEPLRARTMRADGRWAEIEAVAANLVDNPVISGHVITVRDVTERRQTALALAEAQERFRAAFEQAPIGMVLTTTAGLILRANYAIARMIGYTAEELVGMTMLDLTHPDDLEVSESEIQRIRFGSHDGYRLEKRYVHRDGRVVWAATSVSIVRDEAGAALYAIGQIEDITERKAIGERLAHAAIHDPLTGLPNRVLFMDRLEHALAVAARGQRRVAVVFLDLDRFKFVNDSLGHAVGDRLLVAVADRLRSALRPSDTVARFGGDEFVVLCDDVAGEEATLDIASRMAKAVARPVLLPEGEVFVTASLGVAVSSRPGDTADSLLRDADTAMYRAKEQGRARTEVFDERTHARAVHQLRTGNDLHRALERGEFRVHYQPVVHLNDGSIGGFEALVRWQHPTRGLIHPGEFITLAEETGLIVPLGLWVLEEACTQVATWQASRPAEREPLCISVNLSPRQLAEPTLADDIARILERSGIDHDAVWLEITESTLMHDAESAISALRALRSLGVHLSVDDFGTGYSSLSYLKRFPVEALKVDRSFVDGLGREPGDTAIVTAVVTLAHALGLRAVAEGVETEVQVRELRALGCDLAQGYLFSTPKHADHVGDGAPDDPELWRRAERTAETGAA
ncbi:MAG TPA: EAL domain-containing protein [Acidimicrobiia bacterium]